MLRGWKPDRSTVSAQLIQRGNKSVVVEDNTAGWLESVSFYSSNASCKMVLTVDSETYEYFLAGLLEAAAPIPYHTMVKVEVELDTQSSIDWALYNVTLNRIVIVDKEDFMISIRETLFGKWGRILDYLDWEVIEKALEKKIESEGIKIEKDEKKEKVLPSLRRYEK